MMHMRGPPTDHVSRCVDIHAPRSRPRTEPVDFGYHGGAPSLTSLAAPTLHETSTLPPALSLSKTGDASTPKTGDAPTPASALETGSDKYAADQSQKSTLNYAKHSNAADAPGRSRWHSWLNGTRRGAKHSHPLKHLSQSSSLYAVSKSQSLRLSFRASVQSLRDLTVRGLSSSSL